MGWFAGAGHHAVTVAYTSPDALGNRIRHTLWYLVGDPVDLPARPDRPCLELRSGVPGAAIDPAFAAEVRRRAGDYFVVVAGPAVDHPRSEPQVLYHPGVPALGQGP